jgi:ribonuclease BN (tRNA processing enzyme)
LPFKFQLAALHCGEATQHQLMRSHLKYTKITRIFITHMHGDHIFGLPGGALQVDSS